MNNVKAQLAMPCIYLYKYGPQKTDLLLPSKNTEMNIMAHFLERRITIVQE